MLLINLFVVYAIAKTAVENGDPSGDKLIKGLRIVPSASISLDGMDDITSYIPKDKRYEGEGVRIEHEKRIFVVSKAEEISNAVNVLKTYPAPTDDVIGMMRPGNQNTRTTNFIVYFLSESGFNTKIYGIEGLFDVFVSTDSSLASELNIPFPGTYGYNSSDNLSYILSLDEENTRKILSLSGLPMVGFTSPGNISLYRSLDMRNMKIFYIFFDAKKNDTIVKEYSGLLNDFKYEMRMILIPDQDAVDVGEYGLTEDDLPGCISINDDGGKYVQKSVTRDNIGEFIKNVLDGKAEAFYKSQEDPKDNDKRGVKMVTRKNINMYLDDLTKDRMIVFGSQRCPHCVKIQPVLEKLGSIVRMKASDKVMVGYCDVGKNDMNEFEFRYVPTVLLYKAGERTSVPYNGEKSLESLVAFIRDGGGLGVDLSGFIERQAEERFEIGPDVIVDEGTKAEL